MKPARLLLLSLGILIACSALLYAAEEDIYHPESIGLTPEEMTRLDEIGIMHERTDPPTGGFIRNPAEWEPSEGVIIRWPLGIPYDLIAEYSNTVTVWTICGSASSQQNAESAYQSNGVNMDNCEWIIASTNTYWTRDYGPWFIFSDESMEIVDHIYNRPRPQDDLIPSVVGSLWGMSVYGMDLTTTGGNHMSDGLGVSMSTELVYNENPSLTDAEVDSIMLEYLGNQYEVLDYIEYSGIHHIDCWAKFLNPTTVLVKDVPSGDYSHDLLNDRADQLSQMTSSWGEPYTVVRVYCPYGTAYTNSIILNDKVFVPTFNSSWDAVALQTYEDAMPGYEVIGFDGSWLDDDAIHCRAMGVPDREMLRVHHVPLQDTEDTLSVRHLQVVIQDCSQTGLITDSLKVYYSIDGGAYTSMLLSATAHPDTFEAYLPVQSLGTTVNYFVKAADNSGRVETHPFIGEAWAHEYEVLLVNDPPQFVAINPQTVIEGDSLHFRVTASDPDGTIPALSALNLPTNSVFEDNGDGTGDFSFTPTYAQAGSYYPKFVATDGFEDDTITVTITVQNVNLPPTMDEIADKEVDEGQTLSFYVFSDDPDGTDPELTCLNMPDNATFNDYGNSTGRFVFNPDYFQEGLYSVMFIADDGEYADTQYADITVNDVNLPVTVVEPDTMFCRNTETFAYSPEIIDADDTVFTITYSGYPGWISVVNDTLTGVAPDLYEVLTIGVTVADEASSDSTDFNLFVYTCGNVNGNGGIDIDDIVMLINYVFTSGTAPYPVEAGNSNCVGGIDIDDVVHLIAYVFGGGPAPCSECP